MNYGWKSTNYLGQKFQVEKYKYWITIQYSVTFKNNRISTNLSSIFFRLTESRILLIHLDYPNGQLIKTYHPRRSVS